MLHALAAVAVMVGVRSGAALPAGSLTAGRPIDRVLGPGVSAEVDLGASIGAVALPYAFAERTWFGCGRYDCDATSWMFGAALRLQTPGPRARAFVEVGAGYRTLEAASLRGTSTGGFVGTSANLSFFQKNAAPRFALSGVDLRLALGGTVAIHALVSVDLIAQLSVGRFARWTSVPGTNLDPNATSARDETGATHAFYGLALAVRVD